MTLAHSIYMSEFNIFQIMQIILLFALSLLSLKVALPCWKCALFSLGFTFLLLDEMTMLHECMKRTFLKSFVSDPVQDPMIFVYLFVGLLLWNIFIHTTLQSTKTQILNIFINLLAIWAAGVDILGLYLLLPYEEILELLVWVCVFSYFILIREKHHIDCHHPFFKLSLKNIFYRIIFFLALFFSSLLFTSKTCSYFFKEF